MVSRTVKKLLTIFLFLSSTACWALPQCRGTNTLTWHNCHGTATWNNNDTTDGTYTGEWFNGERHGWGVYKWKVGGVYEGQWRSGKRNGHGMASSQNGDRAIGEFYNEQLNGKATYYYNQVPNRGDVYIGQFRNHLKNEKAFTFLLMVRE